MVEKRQKQTSTAQTSAALTASQSLLLVSAFVPAAPASATIVAPRFHAIFAIAVKELERFRILGSAELAESFR